MTNFASSSVKPLTVLTEDDGVPGSKIEQDPENYTVEQLKRWLKCRGLKQSGKRGEIVQRVSDCLKGPNHRILDVSIDGGKWFAVKVLKENEELSKKENVKGKFVVPAVPASFASFVVQSQLCLRSSILVFVVLQTWPSRSLFLKNLPSVDQEILALALFLQGNEVHIYKYFY